MDIDLKPLYWIIGSVLVANVGAIITMIITAGRGVWWLSKLDSRVDDAKDCAVRAHKRVDKLEAEP